MNALFKLVAAAFAFVGSLFTVGPVETANQASQRVAELLGHDARPTITTPVRVLPDPTPTMRVASFAPQAQAKPVEKPKPAQPTKKATREQRGKAQAEPARRVFVVIEPGAELDEQWVSELVMHQIDEALAEGL